MSSELRLRQISYFLEIARRGSISVAASHLNVSQPAVSKTLRELEQMLGKSLFDRRGRGLALNEAGKIFQQEAGTAVNALKRAQDRVRNGSYDRTRLAIGVLPSVASNLVPRAALRFQDSFANCTLRIATGPNWQLLNQLRDASLDMVIGRMPGPDNMVGLSFQHLSTQEVIAVVRPKHPQLEAGFSPEVLQDYPLILPPKGALISPAVMSYLQLNGQQNIQPMFESVSLSFGRKVVMLSDAIWFISRSVVEDDLEAGSLSELPLQNPMMAGAIGICLREGAMYSDEIRGLIDILMEMASAGAPSSAS